MEVRFHDLKKAGVPSAPLQRWIAAVGWQALLNRRGTTWRMLAPEVQASATDAASAAALLSAHASVIKRPVIEWAAGEPAVTVGFAPEDWLRRLGA